MGWSLTAVASYSSQPYSPSSSSRSVYVTVQLTAPGKPAGSQGWAGSLGRGAVSTCWLQLEWARPAILTPGPAVRTLTPSTTNPSQQGKLAALAPIPPLGLRHPSATGTVAWHAPNAPLPCPRTHLSIGAPVLESDPGAVALLPSVYHRELSSVPPNFAATNAGW